MTELPDGLPACDPHARVFPVSWKEAYFRLYFDHQQGGYVCPGCQGVFRGPDGFSKLAADHRVDYALGGKTTWVNMQLLCTACHSKKTSGVGCLE